MSTRRERISFLLDRDRYPEAAHELRALLGDDPDDALAHALLAFCLSQSDEDEEALQHAREAVHLAPDEPLPHHMHAQVLHSLDDSKGALAAIREAVRLDPEDANHYSVLGSILLGREEWQEALDAADQGLSLDPENAECSNLKAMALRQLGRRGAASEELVAQLARDPLNADTHANRGWQLLEEGDTNGAMAAFREALRLEPENEWAREGLVEAIKARNPIYRVVLRYMFFMSRQSTGMRWGIIIGAWFLYRVVRKVSRENPDLAPWLAPLIVIYLAFVMLSWFGDHFFNLLLRVHPQGRYALSKQQRHGANAIGVLLVLMIGAVVAWALTEQPLRTAAMVAGLYTFCLMIPVSGYFSCERSGPRRAIGILIGVHLLLGIAMLVTFFTGTDPGAVGLIWVLTIIASPWFVNYQLMKH
ncbi:MAG: tetratricopeptide repeat protein [Planctomycetota bacterium]